MIEDFINFFIQLGGILLFLFAVYFFLPENIKDKLNPFLKDLYTLLSKIYMNIFQRKSLNYMKMIDMSETGLNSLIKKGYELLSLQTFFTSGPKESRAWTITKKSTAPKAAGEIHSDFEEGFIRAETISYEDFLKHSGWLKSKEAGKMRLEGKDYVVKDGDILNFRFNT